MISWYSRFLTPFCKQRSTRNVGSSDSQKWRGHKGNSSSNTYPLRSMQEENEGVGKENHVVLVAPINATEEEKNVWFKGKLHEFHADKLSRQFHARVLGFFSHECESPFFMTWECHAGSYEARELLSIESLFKVHPKACLAVTPDFPILSKGTPAEAWLNELSKGKKSPGEISLFQNLSDLIRLADLYKNGGVYLDTSFVVLKPSAGLRNSIAAQSMASRNKHWTRLNNAVLRFDMNHPLLLRFSNELVLAFNGNKWGHNGPYMQ
ncbi:unnamed protein product [Sphenostylis stenocarpa]|uniref:Alpha 1,4-glycosyltransferase domain-containing protein n=1 Tax=Sphenostylis stenocarpa TaxID=92480 RepID=A0AA86V8Q1_9FABA|nr:unnamed protein product [Sphenostylis stenocarpa]